MKDYEIVCTFLNGCAGAAHPQTSFEEVRAESPEAYLRKKHGRDFDKFIREEESEGHVVYAFRDMVTYIYEFNEL